MRTEDTAPEQEQPPTSPPADDTGDTAAAEQAHEHAETSQDSQTAAPDTSGGE